MIITHLRIRDFQSIREAQLDLAEWTSLIGESDTGKSAVLRALRALVTNRRGDTFIRHGAREAIVAVTLADGTEIEWRKARGRSGTYLLRRGIEEQVYEKTGNAPPEAIEQALRMAVDVDGEPVMPGLQLQHDPPFLLADTPRRRAMILGEFDGTNILLAADGTLRSERTQQQRTAASARADAERITSELDAYSDVDRQYESASRLAVLTAELDRRAVRLARMQTVAEQWTDRVVRADQLAAVVASLHIDPLIAERIAGRTHRIRAQIEYGTALRDRTSQAQVLASRRARLHVPAQPDLASVARLSRMAAIADEIMERDARVAALRDQRAGVEAERIAIEADAAGLVGAACPTCGQPMTVAVI